MFLSIASRALLQSHAKFDRFSYMLHVISVGIIVPWYYQLGIIPFEQLRHSSISLKTMNTSDSLSHRKTSISNMGLIYLHLSLLFHIKEYLSFQKKLASFPFAEVLP